MSLKGRVGMIPWTEDEKEWCRQTIVVVSEHMLLLVGQSYLILSDPVDCHPPGSYVYGILQARILECVAMPSSRGSSRPRGRTQFSLIAGGLFTVWATRVEKAIATHSTVLAWRILGMAEPGGLLPMGSHRVGHDWSDLAAAAAPPGKPGDSLSCGVRA